MYKLLFTITICFFTICELAAEDTKRRHYQVNILQDIFEFNEHSKKSVKLDDLYQGCPRVDCIPSIDNPEFILVKENDFMNDDDVTMTVFYNGIRKVYPRKILQLHEIVNDYFADKPLAVTYCPLCGSAVAFIPIIDGERVELGVSGLLHNSDLVMYDRKTQSLWGQITGTAIVGSKTGDRLSAVNVSLSRWKHIKNKYPKALLLAPPGGHAEHYNRFRYQHYTQSESLIFPVNATDTRLAAKAFVFGIEIDGMHFSYEESYLVKHSPVIESFADRVLRITIDDVGEVIAKDKKTGETFNVLRNYWFAWYAFYPKTYLRK